MNYENWNAGGFGQDNYGEGFGGTAGEVPNSMPGGYVPSGQPMEDHSAGAPEVRIRDPRAGLNKAGVSEAALAQTRSLLGLGAPTPSRATAARPQNAPAVPPPSGGWRGLVLPALLIGGGFLAWKYWPSEDQPKSPERMGA